MFAQNDMTNYSLRVKAGHTQPKDTGMTPVEPCTWFFFKWYDENVGRTMDWRYYMKHSTIDKLDLPTLIDEMFDLLMDQTLMEPW